MALDYYRFQAMVARMLRKWGDGATDDDVFPTLATIREEGVPDERFLKPVKRCYRACRHFGAQSVEFSKEAAALGKVFDAWKEDLKETFLIAKMKRVLELLLPHESARVKARNLDPDSPVTLSRTITDLLDDKGTPEKEFRNLCKYANMQEQIIKKLLKKVRPRKYMSRAAKLRKRVSTLLTL